MGAKFKNFLGASSLAGLGAYKVTWKFNLLCKNGSMSKYLERSLLKVLGYVEFIVKVSAQEN